MTKVHVRSALPLLLATGALAAAGCGDSDDDQQDKGGRDAAPAAGAADAKASDDAPRVKGHDFSFAMPAGYKQTTDAEDKSKQALELTRVSAGKIVNIIKVDSSSSSEHGTPEEIQDELRAEIEQLRTSNIEDVDGPEFDGEQSGAIEYVVKEDGKRLRGRMIGVLHGKRGALVTLTATPKTFEEATATVDELASSWTWSP